ncbi:MAG: class I SAM-dependent methyltransferase [Candidatus Woesebacteria bacterium]|nr:class I SAM-dependent methyltransferase [Candidatus Woesebacteria bacterium]
MNKETTWTVESKKTITPTKLFLVNLSIKIRTAQFGVFEKTIKPTLQTRVIDVGVASDETLKDSNLFEKLYKYPKNLTLVTIEDSKKLKKMYPECKVIHIERGEKLPFKNKSFDIAVSWASLEHVGGYKEQEYFLNELLRVGEKIFVTTPYRGAIYEPHSGIFFLHWLPLNWFRKICKMYGKKFWDTEDNLNPLWLSDLRKMKLKRKIKFKVYRTFHLLPSHIIIIAQ